jgi:hypothetical protein
MSTGIEVFCSVSSVHFIVCHFPIEHFSFAELTVLLRCSKVLALCIRNFYMDDGLVYGV